MPYSKTVIFGDSLVDSGNALALAYWYDGLPFTSLPDGAPIPELGYFEGRFSNGYNFADLISNKEVGLVTEPVFPFGYEDPWFGIPIAPFASDPEGDSLNFAYGGAQVIQGSEAVPDLDGQTDAFRDAVDRDADPDALYIITVGGNDIRSLAPAGSDPTPQAEAYARIDDIAEEMIEEMSQLMEIGAVHFELSGMADVGLIPRYDLDGNNMLDATEAARAAAASDYSRYLDLLIRTEVIPALEALGADITYSPLMDYVDGDGAVVTGALNAILPTIAALNGLTTEELSNNLLLYQSLIFVDLVHPNAQVHALVGSLMLSQLHGTPWIETMPLASPDIDYALSGSIDFAGDTDTLLLSLVEGTTYTFEMLGVSSLGTAGTLADSLLTLFSANGATVAVDDDSGLGFDANLTVTVGSSETYSLLLAAVGMLSGDYLFQAAVVSGAAMMTGNSYVIDNGAVLVLEGEGGVGVDVISTSVDYVLAPDSEIEVLQTTDPLARTSIDLTGNRFDQQIIGDRGNNLIDGGGGSDQLTGGRGSDRFMLDGDALTAPGTIDQILDYGRGDVIDLTRVLSVPGGSDPLAGGYLQIVSGQIQVDLDGGGDDWTTIATVNDARGYSIDYLNGGSISSLQIGSGKGGKGNSKKMAAQLAHTTSLSVLILMGHDDMFATTAPESGSQETTEYAREPLLAESVSSNEDSSLTAAPTLAADELQDVMSDDRLAADAEPSRPREVSEEPQADESASAPKQPSEMDGSQDLPVSLSADLVVMPTAAQLAAMVAAEPEAPVESLPAALAELVAAPEASPIRDALEALGGTMADLAMLKAMPDMAEFVTAHFDVASALPGTDAITDPAMLSV